MLNRIKCKKGILLLICIILIISTFCYNKEKLKFPQNWRLPKKKHSIVFYHNGECSFCYGLLADLSLTFPNEPIISITSLKDTSLLKFHLNEISYQGISYIDSLGMFFAGNQKILKDAKLYVINSQYEILGSWDGYNQNIKKSLKHIIYE